MINNILETAAPSDQTNGFVQFFQDLWNSFITFFKTGSFPTDNMTASGILGRIIIALIFFIVFFYINKLIIWCLGKALRISTSKNKTLRTSRSFLMSILKAFLMIILVVSVLAILGFDLSGLSTIISSAIVAIGLSLQGIISNFASGIIIVSNRKHLVGDFIEVNGTSGTIKEIGILATELVTADNIIVHVPNSTITSSNVLNYNTMKYRRISLTVSVSYSSDIDNIKKIIKYVINKQDGIVKEMPITVVLGELADSSINFYVRCYVPTPIYWDIMFSLNENIFKELVKRNVDIPFSQLDVNIHKGDEIAPKIDMASVQEVAPIDPAAIKNPIASREDDADKDIDKLFDKAKEMAKKTKSSAKKKMADKARKASKKK